MRSHEARAEALYRELAASLDWVNLMTYDYHGTWETRAGMLAPLFDDPADPAGEVMTISALGSSASPRSAPRATRFERQKNLR